MSPSSPRQRTERPARPYDNTRRLAQARQTELAVVDAARALFIADGYASTTVAGIARAAGVASQTVYKAFGTKAALLKRVYDVTLAGDAEPVALADRPEYAAVRDATDGPSLLRAYAHLARTLQDRLGPLVAVLLEGAAAGDPELADFAAITDGERLTGTGMVARRLDEIGALRRGLTIERARDALWMLISNHVWRLLVQDRGWSADEYEAWLAEAMIAAAAEPQP